MLIAFEGIHNSGKSTVIKEIKRILEEQGKKVYVSDWNSHPLVKDVMYELRDNNKLCNPILFFFMQMLDFVYRYELEVRPKLGKGYIVIMDRYLYTAWIRGKIRNISENTIVSLCKNMKKPDYCFVLDVPVKKSIARGIPKDNSIWQAGFGITQFKEEFDIKGYYEYLSKQRELYINYEKEENTHIIEAQELDGVINKILSIMDV